MRLKKDKIRRLGYYKQDCRMSGDMRTVLESETPQHGAQETEDEYKPKNSEYIEYELTEEDLTAAYKNELRIPLLQGCLLYYLAFQVMTMFFGAVLFLLYLSDAPAVILLLSILAIPVVCVLVIFYFSRQNRAKRSIKEKLKRGEIDPQYFGRHRLELKEGGTELRYGTVCLQRQYADIIKIVEYPGGIILRYNHRGMDVIPSSAFESAQRREELLNYMQTQISRAKYVGITERSAERTDSDANYVLTYAWDEAGFVTALNRAGRLLFKTRLAWTGGQIILTLFGLLFCLFGLINFAMVTTEMNELYSVGLAQLPGVICIVLGLSLLSPLLVAITPLGKKMYIRQIDKGVIPRDYFETQTLSFKEDRITEKRSLSSFDVMYNRVYRVIYDEDGMYIFLKDKRVFVIPNSAFHSSDRKREIADHIEKIIEQYQC